MALHSWWHALFCSNMVEPGKWKMMMMTMIIIIMMMMMIMIWLIHGIFHTAYVLLVSAKSHTSPWSCLFRAISTQFTLNSTPNLLEADSGTHLQKQSRKKDTSQNHMSYDSYLLVFTAILIASPWPLNQPLFLVTCVKGVSAGRRFNQLLPSQPLPATHRCTNKNSQSIRSHELLLD